MSAQWGYTAENGPTTWSSKWPVAESGKRQSPVDIETKSVSSDPELSQKPISYKAGNEASRRHAKLCNTGAGWKVEWEGTTEGEGVVLKGGALGDANYSLKQFHCHWGRDSSRGSEHTVDGMSYAGELHLVHWNKDAYPEFSEAASKDDGLAVLGVFLKVGKPHPELEKVTSQLSKIKYRGESLQLSDYIDPVKLIPESLSYWTYLGSLTTPPCYESVTWIVFKEPIEVSEEQLAAFRSLCFNCVEESGPKECTCEENGINGALNNQLIENFRPTLPIGDRQLRECGCMN